MFKINADEKLTTLAGTEIVDNEKNVFTVGNSISSVLLSAEHGGKMKLFILAQKFYKAGTIEIDAADLKLVKDSIESTKTFNSLIAGQLLLKLSDIKEDKPE